MSGSSGIEDQVLLEISQQEIAEFPNPLEDYVFEDISSEEDFSELKEDTSEKEVLSKGTLRSTKELVILPKRKKNKAKRKKKNLSLGKWLRLERRRLARETTHLQQQDHSLLGIATGTSYNSYGCTTIISPLLDSSYSINAKLEENTRIQHDDSHGKQENSIGAAIGSAIGVVHDDSYVEQRISIGSVTGSLIGAVHDDSYAIIGQSIGAVTTGIPLKHRAPVQAPLLVNNRILPIVTVCLVPVKDPAQFLALNNLANIKLRNLMSQPLELRIQKLDQITDKL